VLQIIQTIFPYAMVGVIFLMVGIVLGLKLSKEGKMFFGERTDGQNDILRMLFANYETLAREEFQCEGILCIRKPKPWEEQDLAVLTFIPASY